MPEIISREVLAEIMAEREYQDQKWGGADHDKNHAAWDWLVYVLKFAGKAATAVMAGDKVEARRQFVKVAALCVAALEHAPDLQ